MKSVKWVITIGMILFLVNGVQIVSAVSKVDAEEEEQANHELTHEQIEGVTDQFMDILVQEADPNYKVKNYNTKEALLTAFEEVTIRDVAADYVDYYYDEKADGLYILPTETPPWFIKENKYTIKQLDNNKVQVEQTNNTLLHGTYTITLDFSYEQEWKITNLTIQ
ncbi:hypothetical protein JOC34_003147 [Virgibacillus halotolerans]|uniref:hypothetical protein n=1 Tax=Virgibacillus halotolerans TaxID=1071053 RepID=UPI00195F3D5B|nr:hypothetical protein [Virgibacillus halotolerans]MBM7600736.1 hypothetical protein [Virgibacillus halotolerans]